MWMKLIVILFLWIVACPVEAQLHPLLDQYQMNGLAINPAYAGSQEALSVGLYSRNQWIGFEGAPKVLTFFMHSPLQNPKVNLGLMIHHDQVGSFVETGFMLNYAFRIEMGRGKLSLGLAAGMSKLSSDQNLIRYNDEGDQVIQNQMESSVFSDYSFGVYYYTNTYYLGFSMPQLTNRTLNEVTQKFFTTFDAASTNYLLTAGYRFRLTQYIEFLPSTLYKSNPSNDNQVDLNGNFIYKDMVWLGGGYRTNGHVSGLFQLQINAQLRVAYSYGYENSELSSFQQGSHEILILYNFKYLLDVVNPRHF